MAWRETVGNIDTWRKGHLAVAEWIDAWRIVPRLLVAGYGWVTYTVVRWYMNLKPEVLENCNVELLKEVCVIQAPSTQHAALVTAVVGIAAAMFAFYANTGKKWNGFTHWNKPGENGATPAKEEMQQRTVVTKTVYVLDDEDGGNGG